MNIDFNFKEDQKDDFVPIIHEVLKIDDINSKGQNDNKLISILPLRNTVLMPGVIIPINVSRSNAKKLIIEAQENNNIIGVVAQKNPEIDKPKLSDIFDVGTTAFIIKVINIIDDQITVVIHGKNRFKIENIEKESPYLLGKVEYLKDEPQEIDDKFNALLESVRDLSLQIISNMPGIPPEASITIKNSKDYNSLVYFVGSNLIQNVNEKQKILSENNPVKKLEILLKELSKELQLSELKNKIHSKLKTELDQQQKEFFLNQQIKTIQEELGTEGTQKEINDLKAKAKKNKWNQETQEVFDKEIKRLVRSNQNSPDYQVVMNYLDFMVNLPWNKYTKDNLNLDQAQKILDQEHFGIKKIKNRVIEQLAVLKLRNDMKAPILCFLGPPGVGKTSLAKSISKALNRKYVRMSLGGMRDEAEIRGHRKTYIGAMPGRILQNINRAKVTNPVFVLDEIDKLSSSYNGDPSSALLEVLDPEQNNTFYDNYLETSFDLSKVFFIATANSTSDIQPALLDRMEIVELHGYTVEEKLEIAKIHLIPKIIKELGIKNNDFLLKDNIIEKVIENYTRESGVRGLEKSITNILRNIASKKAKGEKYNKEIKENDVLRILGVEHPKDKYENNDYPGVVPGLAWTPSGGEILFIETLLSKGKGGFTLTGNLGEVMKESATIALSCVKANLHLFDIKEDLFREMDVHIHAPQGAIPKDGPSAGITIYTSIISAITQRKIKPHVAMSGEITLRGEVIPVGGIKEKILAAKRADIKEVILSEKNKKDVEDVEKDYIKDLTFHYVNNIDEVTNIALSNIKVIPKVKK